MPKDDILKFDKAMVCRDKPQGESSLRKAKVRLPKTTELFEELAPNQKTAQSDAPPQTDRSHRPRLLPFTERSINL